MVTRQLMKTEFDFKKIYAGDIVSYMVEYPSLFSSNKKFLRHGIVTKVEKDWVYIAGSDYDEFSIDLEIHSSDAEYKELKIVIEGLRK